MNRGHCNNATLTRTDQPNDVVKERVLNKYGPAKQKSNEECKTKPASADPEAVNQESTIEVDKRVDTSTSLHKPDRYKIPQSQRDPRDLSVVRSLVGRNLPVYGRTPPPSTRWPKIPNMQKGRNVPTIRSHTTVT